MLYLRLEKENVSITTVGEEEREEKKGKGEANT